MRSSAARKRVVMLRGDRYRHRHPAREAEAHLRGVPAGGRGHQPQVRRHGPRARHQPRARGPARRRDRRCRARRASAARSRCTCRCATSAIAPGESVAISADTPEALAAALGDPRHPPHRAVARGHSRRPRQPAARRPHHADRRGRSELRARDRRPRPRQRLQGAGREHRHRRARARASSTGRRRYRSTCSCPTCSAGRCCRSSSAIPRRGTSRCRS